MFEQVLRVARRSPVRAALAALLVGASALGLFGVLFVVPPLRDATQIYEAGILVHDPNRPLACTVCEIPVTGDELMSWHIPDDYARAAVLSRGLLALGAATLLLLGLELRRARRPRRFTAGTAATDEIASDMLSSTELFAAEQGGVLLLHPERLTGTLERGDLATPYRANHANLVAAAEMTPRGPAIRIRAGDRVRARIADLALDVEGLVDGRA